MGNLAAFILLIVISAAPAAAQDVYKWQDEKGRWHLSSAPGQGPRAVFSLTVEKITFEYGYAKIHGTAENQSTSAIRSPRIVAKAIDVMDGTFYVEFFSWPAGSPEARIGPRQSAAFSVFLQMPDKARNRDVRFELSTDGYRSDINWLANQQMRVW